ncbi:unnamed protein product [Acanthoscelides obtectus]|uniref:Uncharacterized protein n=1 Tax=Acanthoscelides obtectus TaxID=200917 RepID=A0A9P0PA79_ACAOB|nr:unnamed protein product [Acanthoscelides obtectus]CAK1660583.1 hypothetical protein AOBTE_LOCUS22160 [Acanthoscelides obtectus]
MVPSMMMVSAIIFACWLPGAMSAAVDPQQPQEDDDALLGEFQLGNRRFTAAVYGGFQIQTSFPG